MSSSLPVCRADIVAEREEAGGSVGIVRVLLAVRDGKAEKRLNTSPPANQK
jgi:hypothetical protein